MKLFIRTAKKDNGEVVMRASTIFNPNPIKSGKWILGTAMFAVEVNVPDSLFDSMVETVGAINIQQGEHEIEIVSAKLVEGEPNA